jgi:hypothetical protein
MYFVLPVWLAAGFADYLCHRAAAIEVTSGWKASLLHLPQLGEMAIPTLAAIFFETNALVIGTMVGAHFGCVEPDRRGTDVFPSGSQFLSNRFFARSRSICGPISLS